MTNTTQTEAVPDTTPAAASSPMPKPFRFARFYWAWVAVSLVGFVLGLLPVLFGLKIGIDFLFLLLTLLGLPSSIPQSFVLRSHVQYPWLWITFTLVGVLIGIGTYFAAAPFLLQLSYEPLFFAMRILTNILPYEIAIVLPVFMIVSLAQMLALPTHNTNLHLRVFLWPILSPLITLIAFIIGVLMSIRIYYTGIYSFILSDPDHLSWASQALGLVFFSMFAAPIIALLNGLYIAWVVKGAES